MDLGFEHKQFGSRFCASSHFSELPLSVQVTMSCLSPAHGAPSLDQGTQPLTVCSQQPSWERMTRARSSRAHMARSPSWGLTVGQVGPRGDLRQPVSFWAPLRDHPGRSYWQTVEQNGQNAAIASTFNSIPPTFMEPALWLRQFQPLKSMWPSAGGRNTHGN